MYCIKNKNFFFRSYLSVNWVSLNLIGSLLRLYFSSSVQFDTYKLIGFTFDSIVRWLAAEGRGDDDAERGRLNSISWWCRDVLSIISRAFSVTSEKKFRD